METFKLSGESRSEFSKSSVKSVRKNELIPCVMYGGSENFYFTVKPLEIRDLIYTHKFKIVELSIGNVIKKAIVKDIQFHPVSDNIQHIDFQELMDGRKVKVSVPVKFTGTSKGIKEGGTLSPLMRKVIIKTTPENLVDHIDADITPLGLGQSLRVKNLSVPEGIEVVHDVNTPVAFIEIPRSLKSAKDAASK